MSENQKKIWITGASSGIGKAVAEKFAEEGWKVAVSARRKEILDEMAKNQNIFSYPLDVTDQERVNNVFNNIREFARIHQHDDRVTFKESWEKWTDDNNTLIENETQRLS